MNSYPPLENKPSPHSCLCQGLAPLGSHYQSRTADKSGPEHVHHLDSGEIGGDIQGGPFQKLPIYI